MSELDRIYDLIDRISAELSYGEIDERAYKPAIRQLKFALAELQHDYALSDAAEAAEERGRKQRAPI